MKYAILRFDGLYLFDENLENFEFKKIELNDKDFLDIINGKLPDKVKGYLNGDIVFLGQRFENYKFDDDKNKIRKAIEKIGYKDVNFNVVYNYIKESISESISKDMIIIRVVSIIDDLNKIINLLIEKYRELYMLYLPEISQLIEDHEEFINAVRNKSKEDLMKEFNIKITMGYKNLDERDEKILNEISNEIYNLFRLRKKLREYLDDLMEQVAPNLSKIAGSYIGAKLIEMAGGLSELVKLPSSTIQVLGAEKALFRHLTKNTPPPKHGIIFNHPLIQKLPKDKRGDMARTLASKILIAAKVDYYNPGKNVADEILKELNERFEELKNGDKTSKGK